MQGVLGVGYGPKPTKMLLCDVLFSDWNLVKSGPKVQCCEVFGLGNLVKKVLSPVRPVTVEFGVLVDWNEIYAKALVRPRTVRGTFGRKHYVTCVIGVFQLPDDP
jgi:hypothetical protein